MFKRFSSILTIIICTVLIWAAPCFAIDVTIYGDNSYPPYSYDDNGKPSGLYVKIIKKAFEKIEGYILILN